MNIFSPTTPLGRWLAARRAGALNWLEPLSLYGLFAFLLWKTWLKWPEALIDFSRSLYIPWRMSEGALLYQDVVCNYGPLPLVVQAGGFRLFGPGLDVIVWINIAVTVGIIALIWGIFRTIGNRLSGWLCGVVFVSVFALPFYPDCVVSLFNYITPYCSQATWGFGGVLMTLFSLLRHRAHGRRRWLFAAGIGLAIAFLDKPELLLAALGVLGLYLGLALLKIWRRGSAAGGVVKGLLGFAGWLGWGLAGFLAVYLPVFFIFAHEGGWAYGFSAVNWTLRVFFDPAYARAATSHFQDEVQGIDEPWPNLLVHLGWGGLLLAVCAVVAWAGCQWRKAQAAGWAGEGFVGLILAVIFLVMLLTNWLNIGRSLLVPTVLAALFTVGWALRRGWQGDGEKAREPGLALVASAAALLLVRTILNVKISNYGFFLSVLAALLMVHVLVFELPSRFGREAKPNGLLQLALTMLVLVGAANLGQLSLANYSNRIYPVGTGRDRFYSYPPVINGSGALLNIMIETVEQHFDQVKTVVAFPESMGVNYHLRKIDPVADLQFTPDVLKMAGLDNVLAHLAANPPDAVLIYARDITEYHIPYWGVDEPSGRGIVDWIGKNYRLAYTYGKSTYSITGHDVDIFLRRDLVQQSTGDSTAGTPSASLLNVVP